MQAGNELYFFPVEGQIKYFLLILMLAKKVESPFFLQFLSILNWCILPSCQAAFKTHSFSWKYYPPFISLSWKINQEPLRYCVLSMEYIFQMHPLQQSWKNIYHETLNKKDTQICLLQDHGTWVYLQGGVPTWERKYIVQKPMFSICGHMV